MGRTVDWNDHKYAEIWRHDWEVMQNEALEKAGKEERIDMRSLKRQGITDREPQMHMGPAAVAMERKGIVTAVGEQNRTITESNKVLRGLKRILTSLKGWFQELSDTVRDMKIIDEPKTHNLIDVLNAYRNIRSRERADWNHYAREKGDLKDLKEYTSAFAYMVDNKIRTLEDLGRHLNEVGLRLNELNNRIKRNNRRIRDIADLLKAIDTVKELTPIEEEMKSKRFGRQKFIDEHGSELDRLIKARHLIDKLTQGQKIDRKALLAESERLQREIGELQPDIHWTQIDMDHLKEIRSMVRKVIPDALPQHPKGQPPSMTEQLEEGRNKAELEQIKRRAAEHVLQANPTKQEIGMEEEQKQEQHQNERNG